MRMKRCCLLFCMTAVMSFAACGGKMEHPGEEPGTESGFIQTDAESEGTSFDETVEREAESTEAILGDRRPMVMVNGELYLDTGEVSDITARCGTMDGEITSEVDGSEIPTKDDQSNFGTGYGYQYVDENSIDIFLPYGSDSDDMRWIRFEKEKTTAEE
ncbi:MAG: hypothetical protein Q4C58_12040 [Eubacteriales bacterium]|nr:hypothetical protein [Eubacteriales bacterium]